MWLPFRTVFLHLDCLSIRSLVQSTFPRRTFRQLLGHLLDGSNLKPSVVCKYLIIWRVEHASIIRGLATDQRNLILELPTQPTPWYRVFFQLFFLKIILLLVEPTVHYLVHKTYRFFNLMQFFISLSESTKHRRGLRSYLFSFFLFCTSSCL